ncbi:MAG: hypothetical protein K2Z25_06165 [Beijerinckiaceae bacterium]|nr:hypothetical protein [Beijerinckiaceae bacterium]
MLDDRQLSTLRDYAAGRLGTRAAIEALAFDDYADLIIALAQNDLQFPPPSQKPEIVEDRARAEAILQPLLTRGA